MSLGTTRPPGVRGGPARWLLLLGVGLLLGLAACGSDEESSGSSGASAAGSSIPAKPESPGFALGTQPWIGYGPFTIAQQRGIFDREGLEVEITNFKEDRQINAALASRRLDGVNAGFVQALAFAQANLGTKVVLVQDTSQEADAILAGPGIDSVGDLRGKRVAYEEGTTGEILVRYALAENGLSLDDVKTVPIAATEAGPSIIAGRVDAAYTYEPFVSSAQGSGRGIRPIYTAAERPGLISDVLVVRDEVIEEEPGKVAAMVRAWDGGLSTYDEDPEEGQRIIAEDLGTDLAELRDAFKGITFYDARRNSVDLRSGELIETLGIVADTAREAGLVSGDVDVKSLIDTRFVDAIAR